MGIDESYDDMPVPRSRGHLRGRLDLALGYLSAVLALTVQLGLLWLVFRQFSVLGQAEQTWAQRMASVPSGPEPSVDGRFSRQQSDALSAAIGHLEKTIADLKAFGNDSKEIKFRLESMLEDLKIALSGINARKDEFPLGPRNPALPEMKPRSTSSIPGSGGSP